VKIDAPAEVALRALFDAAGAKQRALADEMHPGWVDAAWRGAGLDAARDAAHVPTAQHSALLARAYGLRWPPLAELVAPVHRLSVLGRRPICRILALFGLQPRRDAVRRMLGRGARDELVGHIGQPAYDWLLGQPVVGLANAEPMLPEALQLDCLASVGYAVLQAGGAWRSREALAITRLSLAPGNAPKGSLPDVDANLASTVIDRLPTVFPEFAWLFGSDMDRALSV
jgi:Bacterial type III secretion protein (HrpB4)